MNIITPDNQVIYNTPQYQQAMKNDTRFGDEQARPGGIASPPSIYLTRLLNTNLESLGKDCAVEGLRVELNSELDSKTLEFKINTGLFIIDSTLLELNEEVIVDRTLVSPNDDTYDHLLVSVDYIFSEEVEENLFSINCSLWDSASEETSEFGGRLVLGLFELLRDEATGMIIAIEDKTISRFTAQVHPPINLRNSIGTLIGVGHVSPRPNPVETIYQSLLARGIVTPYKLFKKETSGQQIHREPILEVLNAFGSEDVIGGIHMSITAALAEPDDTYSLTSEIFNVPAGVTFDYGTDQGGGVWSIDPTDLPNVHCFPPQHSDVDFTIGVRITSTEDIQPENVSIVDKPIIVTIFAEADDPNLSVEDAIATDIGVPIVVTIDATLTDTDGSENLSVEIQNVPQDGTTFNQGTDNTDGTWTFTPAELIGLTITPIDWDTDFILNVIATATEIANASSIGVNASMTVSVKPNVEITVFDASGDEDQAIPMNINVTLVEESGYDLTVEISGVPIGAILNNGTDQGAGVWSVPVVGLTNITITPIQHSSDNFALNIKGTSTPTAGGNLSYRNRTLNVSVGGIADVPNLTVPSTGGWYNDAGFPYISEIPVDITTSLVDTDGSETLALRITNLLPSMTFNNGVAGTVGTWDLDPTTDLDDLKIIMPTGLTNDFFMNAVATATETVGSDTIDTDPVRFDIELREPPINSIDILGMDMFLAIDTNDVTMVRICNNPEGTLYNQGTDIGGGCWEFTPAELVGLMVIPPFTGNDFDFLSLDIRATYNEGAQDLYLYGRLNVFSVEPTKLEVLLTEMDIFNGIDPGDIEYITVCNVASDTVFNVGINEGGGCWKFTRPELDSLSVYFLSLNNTSGQWTVTITFDDGGGTQTISGPFSIGSGGPLNYILDMQIGELGSTESYLQVADVFDLDTNKGITNVVSR
jgi:hypothetical protein